MPLFAGAMLAAALLTPAAAVAGPDAALGRLTASQPDLRVVWRDGGPSLLTGLRVPTQGTTPMARVSHFLGAHAALLNGAELVPEAVVSRGRRTVVRLTQQHGGRPVLDRSATITLDAEGQVTAVHNPTRALVEVAPARIDAAQARALAVEAVLGRPAPAVAAKATARAVVLARGDVGVAAFEVRVLDRVVRVDAAAGEVLGVQVGWQRWARGRCGG